jgi:flagellar hook assembly protein FlgD
MKNYVLRILVLVLGISFAAQVSARSYHRYAVKEYSSVKITSAPIADLSAFGMNMPANSSLSGILLVEKSPSTNLVLPTILRDGGDDNGDDTSGDNDTNGDGDHHHHHGDGDTTNVGDTTHDGDHGGGDDSSHSGDNDSSDFGDHDSSGHHDGNDTIDCGHHGHGDNDNDTTTTDDTSGHSFFGGGAQSITFRTHGKNANVNLQFVNNLTTKVTITNLALASGTNFAIVSGAPSVMHPATLAPGARLTLTVKYTATDMNTHSDALVVSSNSTAPLNTISLHGQQIPAASVSNTLPAGVTISMTPNPMSSHLKISLVGTSTAQVAIYDVNGKQLVSTNVTSSEWLWDGTSSSGTAVLSGTYFVRLTGESTDGIAFNTMLKIVLQR